MYIFESRLNELHEQLSKMESRLAQLEEENNVLRREYENASQRNERFIEQLFSLLQQKALVDVNILFTESHIKDVSIHNASSGPNQKNGPSNC